MNIMPCAHAHTMLTLCSLRRTVSLFSLRRTVSLFLAAASLCVLRRARIAFLARAFSPNHTLLFYSHVIRHPVVLLTYPIAILGNRRDGQQDDVLRAGA
jgi:hypothetical protein